MDLGQHDAAVVSLQGRMLDTLVVGPSAARLRYAYAEALLAAGRVDEAIQWFMKSAESDIEETDAEERAIEIAAERPIDD